MMDIDIEKNIAGVREFVFYDPTGMIISRKMVWLNNYLFCLFCVMGCVTRGMVIPYPSVYIEGLFLAVVTLWGIHLMFRFENKYRSFILHYATICLGTSIVCFYSMTGVYLVSNVAKYTLVAIYGVALVVIKPLLDRFLKWQILTGRFGNEKSNGGVVTLYLIGGMLLGGIIARALGMTLNNESLLLMLACWYAILSLMFLATFIALCYKYKFLKIITLTPETK